MTEALLLSLPCDPLLHICSYFTAPELCLTRLVCSKLQAMIDATNQNPLWKNLTLREGLRSMTPEENKSQTYQAYLQKNWKFCLLKKLPADCFTPTLLNRIRAAIRLGHETIVCQSIDRWKKQPLLQKNAKPLALEAVDTHLTVSFNTLFSLYESWRGDGWRSGQGMYFRHLFAQTALRGQLEVMKTLVGLKTSFLSMTEIVRAFYFSASRGDLTMLRFLLDGYSDFISPTTVDSAYCQAVVFSPCSQTIEFLRTKASTKAQNKEKDLLANEYKNQFCTDWSKLSVITLRAEFYLQQDGFFDSLNSEEKKGILKGLKECFCSEVWQLFITHPQFVLLIAADKDALHAVMDDAQSYNACYTVEALISFLKTLEKAEPQEKRNFESCAAKILQSTIFSGRDDFIQLFAQNFPTLFPADLVHCFVAAAQNSADLDPFRLIEKLSASCNEKMGWFFKSSECEENL
ncbi:MAG TPA: F-box-like domain-containing protein [Rhabdochlamydiaceae bacterium]|nr:F-box-like domain-containing protein [Rhabdochlamydiaceae bacterium]